ncbi:MAG TPA: LysM peptidoglycan-binding domain-containing protein [Acidobacteriota bacterium]|jgi:membrane-bound lytic murein transglycosylase D|nr:LysM peptidoglycan-binding domain-containing protein [Acidobacteriota bacterium]
MKTNRAALLFLCLFLSGCAASRRGIIAPQLFYSTPAVSTDVAPAKNAPEAARPATPPGDASIPRVDPNIKFIQELMDRASALFDEGERLARQGKGAQARERLQQAVSLINHSPFSMFQYPQLGRFYINLKSDVSAAEASLAEEQETAPAPAAEEKSDQKLESAAVDALPNINLYQVQVDPSLISTVSDEVRSMRFGIPISLNDRVLRMMEYYQNRGRDVMQQGLTESGKYLPLFRRIFQEAGVPQDLVYVAQVESLYKPLAYSKARAKGIWQFTRAAAQDYSLKLNRWEDERADIEKSTRAAACYLKGLYERFNDWHMVLAAYNWGPARFERLQARFGNISYWEMTDRGVLPNETVNYVPSVLATIIIARSPERYGFSVTPARPLEFEKINVRRSVRLADIAEASGLDLEELRQLNPELTHMVTPADSPDYQLKVPLGQALDLEDRVAQLPEAPSIRLKHHRVRGGETLAAVAHRYGVSVVELAQANHLSTKSRPRRNALLIIPGGGEVLHLTRARHRSASATYRVRRGDTWARVAQKTGVIVAQLKKLNHLGSHAALRAGTILVLNRGNAGPGSRVAAVNSRRVTSGSEKILYRVRKGDTVGSIAKRYGTDVKSLRRWNQNSTQTIYPGQRLTIFSGE